MDSRAWWKKDSAALVLVLMVSMFAWFVPLSSGAISPSGDNSPRESESVISAVCVNQTTELQTAVGQGVNWALRIDNSNGKPGPGVLRHRLTWLGSYEQCISTHVPPPHPPPDPSPPPSPPHWLPHYCLAAVTLQQFEEEVTRIGLCFPDGCSGADVQTYLQQRGGFQGLEELQLTVKSVDHVVCQPRDVVWSSATVTVVAVCCLLGAVVGFATVHQWALKVRVSGARARTLKDGSEARDLAHLLRGSGTHAGSSSRQDSSSSRFSSSSSSSPSSSSLCASSSLAASEYTMLLSRPITPRGPEQSRVMQILKCFSLEDSINRLTRWEHQQQPNPGQGQGEGEDKAWMPPRALPCLHGLRVLSTLWAICGHMYYFVTKVPSSKTKICLRFGGPSYSGSHGGLEIRFFLMLFCLSVACAANLKDAWRKTKPCFFFQPVANCFLAGDTFLFISGLLACYLTLRRVTNLQTSMNIPYFLISRWLRILPVYATVMVLVVFIVPHIGEGPMWSEMARLTANCGSNWWSNLLFLNNIAYPDSKCLEWTWYLALDMQFYMLSPLFILFLHYFAGVGLFLCGVAVVVSTSLVGLITAHDQLFLNPVRLPQLTSAAYIQDYLMQPYCRAAPYVIGILTGFFLHHSRCRLTVHPMVKAGMWVAVVVICSLVVFGTVSAANGVDVGQSATSFYFAMSHLVWTLSVACVVILCCTQNGGCVNAVLSWKVWVPLSRLSLCVFLIHPVIIISYFVSLRTPFFITPTTMGFTFMGNVVFSYAAAFLLYLGVESPVSNLNVFRGL